MLFSRPVTLFVSALVMLASPVVAEGKGPMITSKVYFKVKHGDVELGQSKSQLYFLDNMGELTWSLVVMGLYGKVSCIFYALKSGRVTRTF